VGRVESAASQRVRLLLAEDAYRERFGYHHPVVPNSTPSPETVLPSGDDRVVYVGSLSQARGVPELCELGEMLRPDGVTVHLVGGADVWSREQLERAHADGDVVWHGFVPNAEAMRQVDGALAGLSLLHDEPNYAHSMPTKVIEYMAHGVPVVTTPTQRARELVERAGCGVVVPFAGTAEEAAEAVRALRSDPGRRQAMADSGRAVALADYDWRVDGPRFVAVLEDWVRLKPQR
jgi:glycosyltransferase involved in cell wall biosynthesis